MSFPLSLYHLSVPPFVTYIPLFLSLCLILSLSLSLHCRCLTVTLSSHGCCSILIWLFCSETDTHMLSPFSWLHCILYSLLFFYCAAGKHFYFCRFSPSLCICLYHISTYLTSLISKSISLSVCIFSFCNNQGMMSRCSRMKNTWTFFFFFKRHSNKATTVA